MKHSFMQPRNVKWLLVLNALLAILYFVAVAFWFPKGDSVLFWLLIVGEVFHIWQVFGYIHTVWGYDRTHRFDPDFTPNVDVFITVTGEPSEIVAQTVAAAVAMDYPNFTVNILNDGYVAGRENWREAVDIAKKYQVGCITRKKPGGAKAGNINHALTKTSAPFIVVFDADHIPHSDFLAKMAGYFANSKVAFAQSPQYYKNHRDGYVPGGAWEQQSLFFGAICRGKDRTNSAFMCGTNMMIRRQALDEVGGMCETNIAEDFLTSLFVHERGWESVYVPEVLAEGLAPEDFMSYYKQQFRWARGSLEVIFKYNPLFRKGLSLSQKIQYLSSSSFYLSGVIVIMNAILPLVFFYTGLVPLTIDTMVLALIFLPYIIVTLYALQISTNFSFTFRALAFSLGAFWIHLRALAAVLLNIKSSFAVTSKQALKGNFLNLVIPQFVYIGVLLVGFVVSFIREGLSASLTANAAWAILYIAVFLPFIVAALPDKPEDNKLETDNGS